LLLRYELYWSEFPEVEEIAGILFDQRKYQAMNGMVTSDDERMNVVWSGATTYPTEHLAAI